MKKRILCCLFAFILAIQAWGCGEANQDRAGSGDTAGEEPSEAETFGESGLQGEDLFLSLEDLPWRDNSLDAYSAVLNVPLQYTKQEGAVAGGIGMYILGSTRASYFKKHLFEEGKAAENWDEIKVVTDQGEETSFRLAFQEGQYSQVWAAGSAAGSDRYIIMGEMEEDDQGRGYPFFETDQDMQILNTFYVDFLDRDNYESPTWLQTDAGGNLHMITSNFDRAIHYYIVSPEGSLLQEVSPREGFPQGKEPTLFSLYDGRVGMRLGEQLKWVDPGTGKAEVLADIKQGWRGCTLLDEKTLLYADSTGLYRSGLFGENPEILYTWSNHGVSAAQIEAMQVTEGRDISLIYSDSKGANYLKLTPTTEEVEIQEITLGVGQGSSKKYSTAVTAFNKKYPTYRIKLKTYGYNDTSLLTEMISGGGPVLVDTFVTGFENNAEWWEPLDEFFRQMGLDGELIPEVMDAGRIGGRLYGVVSGFTLKTVVTLAEEPAEWDYDAFLNCFDEEAPFVNSVYTPRNGPGGLSFMVNFFYHGLEGKYLFDAESGTTYFDSDRFRKILRLASRYEEKEQQGTLKGLSEGATLCAVVEIDAPIQITYLRLWGGDKLKFIGFPSQEGSAHYIEAGEPIAIRANASSEEKRLAYSFLQFMLSYEAQTEIVYGDEYGMGGSLSVRRDALEEQIKEGKGAACPSGFEQQPIKELTLMEDRQKAMDPEVDGAVLYELLEKAEPKQNMPSELVRIFTEELDIYLNGNQTEDMVIEHLTNRVGLYLSEQK